MHPCFAMAIVNLRQASAHWGLDNNNAQKELLQAGELSAYVRSGPDLRATYLDVAPKPADAETTRSGPYVLQRQLPALGADYESWPKPSGID